MKCPRCGATDQNGNYCAECGAALDTSCPQCGHAAGPGDRYCTACGTALDAGAGGAGGLRPGLVIAAAALLVVVLVLFLPRRVERVPTPGGGGGASGPAAPSGQDAGMPALSPDMRTNADRLYNRVMRANEQGDQAEVERFIPMAIQAYELVEELDTDGLYHLAILHATAGDHDAALESARRILARHPDHILALGVAAGAGEARGEEAAAREHWQRLLEAYPAESARPLPEYTHHERMLNQYHTMARQTVDP